MTDGQRRQQRGETRMRKPDMVGFLSDDDESTPSKPSLMRRVAERAKSDKIQEAREILETVKALTGMSFSRMANEAGFAASTVSRFIRDPQFMIKPSTLLSIVSRACDMAIEDLDSGDIQAVVSLPPDELVPGTWSRQKRIAHELIQLRSRAEKMQESRVVAVSAKASLTDSAIRIVGAVEAGVFQEAFEIPIEDQETLPIGAERYGPGAFCLEVRGDSMDKRFPAGTLLICRTFDPETEKLPDNRFVIAMRRDSRTDQVEATVKRLVRTASGGSYVLIPESNNPVHAPLPLEDLGEFSVYISAIVVAAVNAV